jgi:Ca2+-binding RTX toxin-like protein
MPFVRFAPRTGTPAYSEGATAFPLTLVLSEASSQTVTATVAINWRSEAGGADIDTSPHTVTFAPGQTSATINLQIWDDNEDEIDENVVFEITETTNASRDLSSTDSYRFTGEIIDNDVPTGPTVRFAPGTGSAGFAEGAGHVELILQLSQASTQTVTATVSIFGAETDSSDIDYAPKTVTFAPGETTAILSVPIYEDSKDEADEDVTFRIGEVTNGSRDLSSDSAYRITTEILDNDLPVGPTVRFAPGTPAQILSEDGGYFEFTLLLSQASSKTVSADIGVAGDWDHADLDLSATRAVFAPGQTSVTIRIPIRDDGLDEPDAQLTFEVTNVFNASRDYSSIEAYRVTGVIVDNDGPPAQLIGTAGNDLLTGTAGADLIRGLGGDDVINPGIGDDEVAGGDGNDLLILDWSDSTSGQGLSWLSYGSTGVDGKYWDADGHSVTFSGIERFDITAGSGNDGIMVAGFGTVDGGAGNDSIWIADQQVSADGGSGELDGLSVDLGRATTAINWSIPNNSYSGPAGQTFTNFEYLFGITTGSGNDRIETGHATVLDNITTGAGDDEIIFYDGRDTAHGGDGDDLLIVDWRAHGAGIVTVTGFGSPGAVGAVSVSSTRRADFDGIERLWILTGAEADRIEGSAGAETLDGGGGDDIVRGAGGNDLLIGGGGSDLLEGGGGDDVLNGGEALPGGAANADTMRGGIGNDVYFVDHVGDLVEENAGEGTDEVRTALASYVLAANIETLTGTSPAGQALTGNSGDNVVNAGSGNDVLRLDGGGNDAVNAGAGNDNIFFIGALTSADVVNGGAGSDTLVIQGPYGALTLTANVTQIENISILGGNNVNFGEPGTNRYDYSITTNDLNFAAGVQARINGSALLEGEDFTFNGSAETNASFVVYGGKGVDTLTGGLGNDIFFYAEERFASGDTVNGGAGYDGMFLRGNYTIDFNAPGYTGLFTNIENLTLTSATDERYARGGGTEFDYSLTLSDAIVGAGQTLTVSGALLMATETMILDASLETNGILRLFGGKSADTLKGGAQADYLHGNLGADMLAGGGGADLFRYDNVAESNSASLDHILDFTPGTDRIELSRIDANTLAAGDQAFSWIGSSAFTGSAGELRAFESGGSWFVEGDTNGDGAADLVIQLTLQGPTPLGAGDFIP